MPLPEFTSLPHDVVNYCLLVLFSTLFAIVGAKSALTTEVLEAVQALTNSRSVSGLISAPIRAAPAFCLLAGGLWLALDTFGEKLESLNKAHPGAPDGVLPFLVVLTFFMVGLGLMEIVKHLRSLAKMESRCEAAGGLAPHAPPRSSTSHGKQRNRKRR